MRRVVIGLLVALVLAALPVGLASAAGHPTAVSSVVPERVTAGVHAVTPTPAPPTTTNINQQQHNADVALAQHKAIVAVVALLLLVIVYFGHRARYRHRRKLRNLQNAKS